MPLIRCSDQKRETLEEFYTRFSQDKDKLVEESGKSMLAIIRLLNETFSETTVYGLTSLMRLVLLRENTYKSPWYIIISASFISPTSGEWRIEYLLPTEKQPWKRAHVLGYATSLEEFFRMIIIAMVECEGWPGNAELSVLYKNVIDIKQT